MKKPFALLLLPAFIFSSLVAFKSKPAKPMILHANLSWRTEVSYNDAAQVTAFILHNNKQTELMLYRPDPKQLTAVIKEVSQIGNPVTRVVLDASSVSSAVQAGMLHKKFPLAKILVVPGDK